MGLMVAGDFATTSLTTFCRPLAERFAKWHWVSFRSDLSKI